MFKREIIIISVIVGVIFIIIIVRTLIINQIIIVDAKCKNEKFSGIIKKIEYDAKYYPTIYFNDTCYYIGNSLSGHDMVFKIGDSIDKEFDRLDFILYRKDRNGVWRLVYGVP